MVIGQKQEEAAAQYGGPFAFSGGGGLWANAHKPRQSANEPTNLGVDQFSTGMTKTPS